MNDMGLHVYNPCTNRSRSLPYCARSHSCCCAERHTCSPARHEYIVERPVENFPGELMWKRLISKVFQSEAEEGLPERIPTQTCGTDHLICSFDLPGFEPTDIKVKVENQKLVIEATKETTTEEHGLHCYSKKIFHHSIVLPANVKLDDLTSALGSNGVLRVRAPVISLLDPEEREIEVIRENSENQTSPTPTTSKEK